MLAFSGVSYTHPSARAPALLDLSFSVRPGEIVGVVGANDSGKSTLCLLASGAAPAITGGHLTGTITLHGDDLTAIPREKRPAMVGALLDNASLQISRMARTVQEEVAFGPGNLGLGEDEILARARAALSALNCLHLAQRPPGELSGGELQLVALAGVLAFRARYLVLDDPAASLDSLGKRVVSSALRAVAAAGTGILLSTHDIDLLEQLAHTVLVLHRGTLVAHGPALTLLSTGELERYGVAATSSAHLAHALTEANLNLFP